AGVLLNGTGLPAGQLLIVNDPLAVPMVTAREVQQDAVQPGIDTRPAPKPASGANGLEQGLLHEVLCFGFVAAEQTSRTEQAVPAGSHQFLRGSRVLAAERLGQLLLVHALFVPPGGKGFKESACNCWELPPKGQRLGQAVASLLESMVLRFS